MNERMTDPSVQVLAIIPCRSGSKGIPHKNIQPFLGKPLMAHSIECALASKVVTRTVVSTDDPEYAKIARKYGAEVPFLRPVEIAGDLSTDLEVFLHALNWFRKNEEFQPEFCLHLRPTYPVRNVEDVDKILKILMDHPEIDSVRSVVRAPETPYKMWFLGEGNLLSPVIRHEGGESYNLPRQLLPSVYLQNACIDAVRAKVIFNKRSMTGDAIYGYVMDHLYDIDTKTQLDDLRRQFEAQDQSGGSLPKDSAPKTFCFDIDGVVATVVPGNDYNLAEPIRQTIGAINRLHDAGHRIILFTARGSATGLDWKDLTHRQMAGWGVKYHELRFGKPAADYYVDDKMIPVERILSREYPQERDVKEGA